jgi:hypothetical protein
MAETAQPTITIGAEMFWAYVPRGGHRCYYAHKH